MEKLKANTLKAQQIIASYENSLKNHGTRDLYQVYTKPSQNKRVAWSNCKNICEKYGGEMLTIVGANAYQFSAAFQFHENNKKCYCYITKSGEYCISVQ